MRATRLLGDSPAMQRLRHRVEHVASTPLPVLVTGETGTGKEVVARLLHEASGRSGPFVPVDCAALSHTLIESELFGHERGAFTGASHRREGLVRTAEGGTFFLDEIGELPLEMQTRLLRLLEQGTYRPVGAPEERQADIRVIAATWRDLRERVGEGAFRQDLFHRLTIIELEIPPLRERTEDVGVLLQHFMDRAAVDNDREAPELTASARRTLLDWPWPGNVRELRNVANYVTAMTRGDRVTTKDLPPTLMRPPPKLSGSKWKGVVGTAAVRVDLPYMEARRLYLDDFQLRYVEAVLEAHDGNVSAAARAAGMDRRSIQRIMARLKA